MTSLLLDAGWQVARAPAGACVDPEGLSSLALDWREASVPGTVAAALHADPASAHDYDADDWWYRVTFAPPGERGARQWLRFEGLATLAQAWLNGERILESRNMFLGHRVEVTRLLRDVNHLAIRFASLRAALQRKHPRPRWKTALVGSQNLRWYRTTLLGRMPGWTPALPAVGPWGAIELQCAGPFDLAALELQPRAESGRGRLLLRATVAVHDGSALEEARVRVGDGVHALQVAQGTHAHVRGDLDLGRVPLWWPHTHGPPQRLPCTLELRIAGRWHAVDCGRLGFREVSLDTAGGRVLFQVNGVPVFCRGVCWAPQDIVSLRASPQALRRSLEQLREAGANMVRVGGTMAYEPDAFYELCDELGLLVWQDFMFANMDYPVGDAGFRAEIEAEARQVLGRLQRRACLAAYCGGSEVAQQAAMMGLPREHWSNEFFDEALPRLCASHHPGVPYFPSTPWGGALPFHVGTGLAHYYGVGAYRRPLADAKTARVKFSPECLAFSNVPEPATVALLGEGAAVPPHHPRWKARVPRDNGAGWDFEDVRDHYLRELFAVDPVALRGRDVERYHALSRAVPGELMRRVFAEWRAPGSECGGALVWLHRDPLPGAGWGIVDATGCPKSAYWHLKRAWAPRSLHLTDEGLDGIAIHVVNDAPAPLRATVEIELLRDGRIATARAARAVEVRAHGSLTLGADALLGHFTDCANAYRFGPAKHDVVAARLVLGDGTVLSEDFLFPAGMNLASQGAARVEARAARAGAGRVIVTLRSDAFLQGVRVACEGYEPDDNHFHMAPHREKVIGFLCRDGQAPFEASFEAINLPAPVSARIAAPPGAANGAETPRSNLLGDRMVSQQEAGT